MPANPQIINALIKGYDPAEREAQLNELQMQRNALVQQPEDMVWKRQQRQMALQEFQWRQETQGFTNADKTMDYFIKTSPFVNYSNYGKTRDFLIQNGLAENVLPPVETFKSEPEFVSWKDQMTQTLMGKKQQMIVPAGSTVYEPGKGAVYTAPERKEVEKSQTPEMLTRGELKEELGREPTDKEVKERMRKEAKGYDTAEEAFAEAQKMVKAAGENAGLVPSYELTANNKYIPKLQPNITLRIPPYVQGQNLPPGIVFNRKTGKYTDTTNGKQFDRKELVNLYGEYAAINADKMALGELTKREQLIKTFTNRIDANVPIVLDAVKDVKNSDVRLYNQAINQGKQYLVGSGKWTALQTAMMSLSNEVQRVESNQLGIGGQGAEERKIWAKYHDPNMSFKDIEEVTKMLLKLSKTAANVIEQQRSDLIKRIPHEGGVPEENVSPKSPSQTKTGPNIEDLRKKYNY